MNCKAFIREQVEAITSTVGDGRVISALSGGVDSSVATLLGHRALGSRLKAMFIDDGLMRQDEPKEVRDTFAKLGIKVKVINAKTRFFDALAGITDAEEKRKAFRDTFYQTFGQVVRDAKAQFLLQGTIAADVIETKKGVKTQHNVLEQIGIDPSSGYGYAVVEPLKTLFKPDVRKVGKALGLPASFHQRMPFPGPGLATRCLGEVTPKRVGIVRKACNIVEEETKRLGAFQCFAVLMADQATGVTKTGRRRDGHIVAVRCVDSEKAITATPTKIPWPRLERIRDRILAEVPSVTKVLYDLTPKPPSTIEYI